jgi:CRP-like cAMP-binding protein
MKNANLTFEKGKLLSEQNHYNRNIYFVEEGMLRMFYYENGKDITSIFILKENYGKYRYTFKNEPSKNNIEAIEKSIITTCNYNKLEELCSVSLTAANFSRYILGNLMLQMSNRIISLQHMSAKEKYHIY